MEVTGYKRSYSVVIRKMLNGAILSGYPKVYPTAIDVSNGYFVLGGAHIPIMTANELQNFTQSEYNARIALLKDYVIQQEGMNPFTNQFNENVVYDPDNCVPQEITTTTTEAPVVTTTTTGPVVTTTTTSVAPITTTTTTTEATTTTTSTSTTTIEITTTTTTSGECTSCVEYGYLYSRHVVEDSRQVTSVGSHIPTYEEVITLFEYYDPTPSGAYYDVGRQLKENGTTHWLTSTNEPDNSGLNLRGGGERDNISGFLGLKSYHNWHCSSANFGFGDGFYAQSGDQYMFMVQLLSEADKRDGWGLRPIKDSTTLSHGEHGTYIGNDGKVYCTICIGTQEWVAEDLAETEYRNHDEIPIILYQNEWNTSSIGARTAFDNNTDNVGCNEIIPATTTTTTEVTTTTTTIAGDYIIDHVVYDGSGGTTTSSLWSSGIVTAAQTVTETGIFNRAIMAIYRAGTPNVNIRAKVYEGSIVGQNSNSITATLLATSTNVIAAGSLPTGATDTTFEFADTEISGQVTFVLTYEDVVTYNSTNRPGYGYANSDVYAGGTVLTAIGTGAFSAVTRDWRMSITHV